MTDKTDDRRTYQPGTPYARLRSKAAFGALSAVFNSEAAVSVRVADLRDVLNEIDRLHDITACKACDGAGVHEVECETCSGTGLRPQLPEADR